MSVSVKVKDYRKYFYFNIKLNSATEMEFIINMKWIVNFHLEFKYISMNSCKLRSKENIEFKYSKWKRCIT